MNTPEAAALLQGFTITRCAILESGETALVAQDRSYPDPLEPKETRIFVYKPFAEPEAQWGSAGIGHELMAACPLEFYSRIAHAEDKLLVVNGAEGAYFDGATWTRFL